MYRLPAQVVPDLMEMAFTLGLAVGGLLLLGGLISFAVFLYQSTRGEGMRDPREAVPEKAGDEGLEEGDADDEWDYY